MQETEYDTMYRLEDNHWWFQAKRNYVRRILDIYIGRDKGRILDLGCGTGRMLALLKTYGRVFGVDYHDRACRFSCRRTGPRIVRGDANRLPFKPGSFELVSAFDLLYHQGILDDEQVIGQVHELLADGGYFLVTDSAWDFLKSRHDLAVMTRHRYTVGELAGKMEKHRFEILKKTYLYGLTFPLVAASRLWDKLRLGRGPLEVRSDLKETGPRLNALVRRVLSWEARLIERVNIPCGSSLMILGRKR
ncbi:MAG: class I SAM-dependent methyltransferase [Deltaproteobacteria bacterium]|nr:class I SAM-dependent methyltransferase [Deltaproteobacteria bacterium]